MLAGLEGFDEVAGRWEEVMTVSALQALGVQLTCDSSCKGRGVRGEGGGPARPSGGLADDRKRSSGAGSCIDVRKLL
jgi:hypothetical protein